jgi:hypothetical protein
MMVRVLVHFAADVFQATVDCALRLGGVLLQQNGADELVDVGIVGEWVEFLVGLSVIPSISVFRGYSVAYFLHALVFLLLAFELLSCCDQGAHICFDHFFSFILDILVSCVSGSRGGVPFW